MRRIALYTETTGLNPIDGHRIVEIGCIELDINMPTGKEWHAYVNPERKMPEAAFAVHGLSESFLLKKPIFKDIAQDFINFINGELQKKLERSGNLKIMKAQKILLPFHDRNIDKCLK